jgi:hypothetical protein
VALVVAGFPAVSFAAPPQDCGSTQWTSALKALDPSVGGACVTEATDQTLGVNLRLVQFPNGGSTVGADEVASWKPLLFESAKTALAKYRGLVPSLSVHDISFVLRPMTYQGNVLAATGKGPQAECLVVISTLAVTPEKRGDSTPPTVAHELAHCLQQWNVPQQAGLPKEVRDWWVEGSAEYLGNVVFENAEHLAADAEELRSGGALTDQVYGTTVLFAWFAQQKNTPAAIFGFWGAMPTSGGSAAQQAALVATVTADGLQKFAQAWVDGTIQMPSGHALPAPLLDPITLTASDTRTVSGVPFSVIRGVLSFPEPGDFTLATTFTGAPGVKFHTGTGWGEAPTTGSDCTPKVTFAGISTSAAAPKLTIVATKVSERSSACPPPPPPPTCTDFSKRDPCLAGEWVFDDAASAAQINTALPDANPKADVVGDIALKLVSDGKATQTFTEFSSSVGSDVDVASFAEVKAAGTVEATWSTSADGTFRLCPTSDNVTLTTTVQLFLGEFNPVSTVTVDGAHLGDVAYTCSATTLTLRPPKVTIQGGAPLIWIFHKKGGGGCSAAPGPAELMTAFLGAMLLRRRRARSLRQRGLQVGEGGVASVAADDQV